MRRIPLIDQRIIFNDARRQHKDTENVKIFCTEKSTDVFFGIQCEIQKVKINTVYLIITASD